MSATRPARPGWFRVDYQAVWRWHFYAGLVCLPFIVVLALTGSIYLFKPQIESWLDRPFDHLALAGPPASASAQVSAALGAVRGARFDSYELPQRPGAAIRVLVRDTSGERYRVYVHPRTLQTLAVVHEERRLMEIVKTIHGELLLGDAGSIVVELAASWAIVMIVTGLYLWWPRQQAGLAGILYPRLGNRGRMFWRDLHAVTGVWISCFALFLLITALPWTDVWGAAFKQARSLGRMGTTIRQDWSQSRAGEHSDHVHGAAAGAAILAHTVVSLDDLVPRVTQFQLAAPVLISPPTTRARVWQVRSLTQNRPLRVAIDFDAQTGEVVHRETFADRPLVDRIVNVGVAAHEGQLFAPLNQVLGVLTAAGLITMTVSGAVMWWRRRPAGGLGAPAARGPVQLGRGLAVLIVILAVLLPVLGASLIAVAALERFVLRRMPRTTGWLGLARVYVRQRHGRSAAE